ncbi:AraC family transcriptional regulator [Burkholderia lata]|nr:AraC family transcriptional regulator [Burkholderia lata]
MQVGCVPPSWKTPLWQCIITQSPERFVTMADLRNVTDTPKGVVGPKAFNQRFRLNRYCPCAELEGGITTGSSNGICATSSRTCSARCRIRA